MKSRLIFGTAFISLFLISFASALSFSETFSFLDPTLITLAILFVVLFAALYFSVSKIFKGQTNIAAVIAIALSLLAVYWINQGVNLAGLFSGWGISNEILYTVGPILFLILVIFIFIKLRFVVFMVLGGILLLAAALSLVYSSDILTIIGIVFILIGLVGTFSKMGRFRSLMAKYRRIQRRNPSDPRLMNLRYKMNQIKPGFGQIKP